MATTGTRWVGAAIVCAAVGFAAYSCGRPRSATDDAPVAPPRGDARAMSPRGHPVDDDSGKTDAVAAASVGVDAKKRVHSLNGSVRTWDGRALGGAVVHAEPTPILPRAPDAREPVEVVADAAGAFDLRGLAAGDWALLVSAEGALRTFVATVRVPERARFDLVLPRGSVIDGTVVDETTHATVAGARVRLRGEDRWIGDGRTSADGRFAMALFDSISGGFRVEAPGYASAPAESSVVAIDETARGRHEVTLVATRGHTLTGAVVGPDGPIAGARVTAVESGESGEFARGWKSTTDVAGRYAFDHLDDSDDSLWVRAEAAGYVQEGDPDPDLARPDPPFGDYVEPRKNGWTAPDVVMRRRVPLGRCTIEGRVLDEEEHAVADVRVSTNRKVGNVETTSGADGAFVLADVPTEATNGSTELICRRDGRTIGSVSAETSGGAHVTGVQLFVENVDSPEAPRRVRGKVSAPDGSAVAGARVVVLPYRVEAREGFGPPPKPCAAVETRTGPDGAFVVVCERDDRVAVAVEAIGFAPWLGDYESKDVDEPIAVALPPARALTGRVVRAGTDVGVAGLDVSLVLKPPEDERAPRDDVARYRERVVATTGADGAFRVEGAPIGATLGFAGAGWIATEIESADVPSSDALRVEIAPALELSGRAEFADGRPCAGVVVGVHGVDEATGERGDVIGRPMVAGDDGSFACGPLPAGKYWLEFAGGSPQVVRRMEGPFEAGTRDLRVTLVLGRTIRGRVLRPDGTPANDVDVNAYPIDREGPDGRAKSDKTGAFAVGGLDDGPYTVATDVDGFFAWRKSGVRADADPVEIRLDEGLAVAGVLRDAKGEPRSFVNLVVEPEEAAKTAATRRGQTDADGRFRITALTRGRWRIKVDAEHSSDRMPEVVVEAGTENLDLRTAEPPPAKDER